MTGQQEAVLLYREAARRHRLKAAEHREAARPLNAKKERRAAEWVNRAIVAELIDPQPE
jgi:hypothetical protein